MDIREPTATNQLEIGDLVMLKNYRSGSLDLPATGPGVFIEFTNNHKTSAMVYNLETKRLHRVKTSHLSPIYHV